MNRMDEEDSYSYQVEDDEQEETSSFQINSIKDEMRQDETLIGTSPLSEVSMNSIKPQHFHFEHNI